MGRTAASALAGKQPTCKVCDGDRLAAAKDMANRTSAALQLVRQRVAVHIETLSRQRLAQGMDHSGFDETVSPPLA
jgi:hypothetical protein